VSAKTKYPLGKLSRRKKFWTFALFRFVARSLKQTPQRSPFVLIFWRNKLCAFLSFGGLRLAGPIEDGSPSFRRWKSIFVRPDCKGFSTRKVCGFQKKSKVSKSGNSCFVFASSIIYNQALVEDLFNRITPWNLLPKGNTWAPFSGVRFFWRCISFLFWAGWCIVSPNAVLARNHFLVDCKHRTRKIKFRGEKWLFWKKHLEAAPNIKKKRYRV